MTAEKIKEAIARSLEDSANEVIERKLNEIKYELTKEARQKIIDVMNQCQVHIAQDNNRLQTNITINFK